MSKFIGRLVDVGIAKEASRGAGATPTFWIPKSNVTIDDKVLKARNAGSYGSINAEGNQALTARRHAEGTLEFDMYDKSFGLFLLAALGTVQTSGPTDSAYTHTFTLDNDNQHQSLDISVQEADVAELHYRLSMLDSLELSVVPDDLVKCVATFMSRSSVGTSVTPSYIAENKFVGRHLTFKLATLASGLGAASNIPLRSLTLRIEKNTQLVHNTASVEPEDILNKGFRITGEIELDYESRDYANLMLDGSYRAVRINLNNAQTLIGTSSTPQFTLDLSRVDFDQWESQRPNDEIASQTLTFTALYDITNSNVINSCTLVNAQSSY